MAELVAGRADSFVGLLGVFHPLVVKARARREVRVPVKFAYDAPSGGEGLVGKRRRVGTHVGDMARLVEVLSDSHRPRRRKAQLATGLLLQRGRHEGRIRRTAPRLLLDGADRELRVRQAFCKAASAYLVEEDDVAAGELTVFAEIAARRQPCTVEGDQHRAESSARRLETPVDVPIRGNPEAHPGPLALDQQARSDRLHPPGRKARQHLAPKDRAYLIAVEPVQDPPSLLSVHQAAVEVAPVVHGPLDGVASYLVEHHALYRHTRVEDLEEVPRDRLSFAVLVCRQVQLARILQERLQLGDPVLLTRDYHIQRLETVVDVNPQPCPGFPLERCRDFIGIAWQVTDVTYGGLHHVPAPEEAGNRLRFCGGLDDD